MSNLMYPSVLIDLAAAGETGLPMRQDQDLLQQLELCREWGFRLRKTNDRIILAFDHDQLLPGWIERETPAMAWDRLRVKGFLSLESTNSEALDLARQGAPSGTLVFSEEQTIGRGRKNREWFSPAGAGLYCTLIVRPKQPLKYWPLLTLAASIALVDTLKDLTGRKIIANPLDIDIKWPNDVLLSGKKCAGILLESLMNDPENPAAVIGFGINVRKNSVPVVLASEAVALDEIAHTLVPRRQLLAKFLNCFQVIYLLFEQGRYSELLDRWKNYSTMWNGMPILIGTNEEKLRQAVTCGLNEIGALLVRTADGAQETLFSETIRVLGKSR